MGEEREKYNCIRRQLNQSRRWNTITPKVTWITNYYNFTHPLARPSLHHLLLLLYSSLHVRLSSLSCVSASLSCENPFSRHGQRFSENKPTVIAKTPDGNFVGRGGINFPAKGPARESFERHSPAILSPRLLYDVMDCVIAAPVAAIAEPKSTCLPAWAGL